MLDVQGMQKRFPAYFENFTLPRCEVEQQICVYRACKTRKIEQASFLNTYEENGFANTVGQEIDDPQEYCLSTYERLRDVKRFVAVTAKYSPPFLLAKGWTSPLCGVSCRTKEWKTGYKGSHVDWWLYEDAKPWEHFEEVDYDEELKSLLEHK